MTTNRKQKCSNTGASTGSYDQRGYDVTYRKSIILFALSAVCSLTVNSFIGSTLWSSHASASKSTTSPIPNNKYWYPPDDHEVIPADKETKKRQALQILPTIRI
jgi:hypothetical protein